MNPSLQNVRRGLTLAGVGILTYFFVFQLPFLFPPKVRLVSPSYLFGFNNAVAVLAMVGILDVLALYRLRNGAGACEPYLRFPPRAHTTGALRLPGWLFVVMAGVYAALTLGAYQYAQHSESASLTWESRHFLHRIKLVELYQLRPYIDFQAEYGPALMWPPVYLHRLLAPLGVSVEGAYFLCHWLMNVAGLGCVFYLISRMSAPARAKSIVFVLVGLAGFGPYMGLNGVLLRFVAPYASIVYGHRTVSRLRQSASPWRWVAVFGVVLLLLLANISLSSEIAIAFTLAWLAYTVLTARHDWRVLATSVGAIVAAAGVCRLSLPEAYYGSLLQFSQGANNFPLLPAAHLVFYLLTLVLVVPFLLATGWRGFGTRASVGAGDSPLLGALGLLSVAMMPGALGRCDPPHVLYYGMGASLLLMMRFANTSRRAFATYAAAYAAVFIGLISFVIATAFFGVSHRDFLRRPLKALQTVADTVRPKEAVRDLSYLVALDKYPQLGLPFATYGSLGDAEAYLFARRQVNPEYFIAAVGVYTEADITRKLADVGRMEFLLVQEGLEQPWKRNYSWLQLTIIRQWFLYPARLRRRHESLDPDAAINQFIVAHYRAVEKVGSAIVMQRISADDPMRPISPSEALTVRDEKNPETPGKRDGAPLATQPI